MKRILSLFVAALLISTCIFGAVPCSAKTIHTKTLSFIDIRANAEGAGYKWNNYDDILTLDGLTIETEDDYGLKINDGATVILKGKNYIKASKAAVFIEGKVIIKGSGTLTLVSDEGIYCSSDDRTDTLTINGGSFDITAKTFGIISDFHTVTINSAKFKINVESGTAMKAQKLSIGVNTNVNADSPLIGVEKLHIEGANLNINTSSEALKGGAITFNELKLKAGNDKNSLASVEAYSGQASVKTVSTYDGSAKSIFLGDKFGAFYDILIFVAIIAVLTAVVVLPIVIKKKKAKAAIEARDKAEEERKAEAKAKKKTLKENKDQ